jgi:Protein of unknown function (DUF2971)
MKLENYSNDSFVQLISTTDSVFHYTKRATALEQILSKDIYRLSSLANANDPYEYKSKMIGASGWGWDDETMKHLHLTSKLLDGLLERGTSFISCCTNFFNNELLQAHGCLKSRMWSQYGENHEGICLVFSRNSLLEEIRKICSGDMYFIYEGNVGYREYVNDYSSRHDTVSVNKNTFDDKAPIEIALNHINTYWQELFFRKQNDYKDEQEFRIVTLQKDILKDPNTPLEIKASKCLTGIILGDRFPEVYFPAIAEVAGNLGLEYRKLHWHHGKYFLLSGKG